MKPPKISVSVVAGLVGSLALVALALADPADPAWWEEWDILTEATENNYGPANIGQAKWMADRAHAAMEASLPGGAGFDLGELFSTSSTEGNYVVLNLGQAKALAKPFYDRLISLGHDTRAGIEQSLFEDEYWTHAYPWDPSTPASENYRPANVGQLKVVFGFDLEAALESSFRPVIWKDHANSVASYPPGEGSRIAYVGSDLSWQWGAEGVGVMYGDGALRFQAAQTDKHFQIGLKGVDDATIFLRHYPCGNAPGYMLSPQLRIYEQPRLLGHYVGTFGTYDTDSVLEVRRVGTTISYHRNGDLLHTTTNFPTGPLKVVSQSYQTGATGYNCLVRGFSNADDDSDGDGMTDAWEAANGFDHFSAADASGDADADGFTNLEEFLAGTDPDDDGEKPGTAVSALQVHTPLAP